MMVVITPIDIEKAERTTPELRREAAMAQVSRRTACFAALALADIAAFVFSFGVAVFLPWQVEPELWQPGGIGPLMGVAAAVLGAVLFALALRGHYSRRLPRLAQVQDVATASVAALLGTGFTEFMLHFQDPRLPIVLGWGLFVPAVVLSRTLARAVLREAGLWQRRVVLVGHGEAVEETVRILMADPSAGYSVAGVVHPALIGSVRHGRWGSLLRQHRAELVVLATEGAPLDITESLVRDRVPFAAVSRLDGLPTLGCLETRVAGHDAVIRTYQGRLGHSVGRVAKVAIDVAASLAMLVLLAPVLLLIAAAIKLDGGPVLYAHRRLGAGGRSFPCFKFRSMVVNSDEVLLRVLDCDLAAAAEWAETHKLRRDPRVTFIGHFLRQTSLDELPQLFNVLRLEMSLVGPRPIVTAEVPRYGRHIRHYYSARPGLTGLWQVSGRSDTGYAERVQLDTWYVRNWSLWRDIAILARTVPAVLQRRGAV